MNQFVIYDNITGQYLTELKDGIPQSWDNYYWDVEPSARFSKEKAEEVKQKLETTHDESVNVHYAIEERFLS